MILISTPKTNCQACEIEYNERIINGYEAYEIFDEVCISYAKPWAQVELINITMVEEKLKEHGLENITTKLISIEPVK